MQSTVAWTVDVGLAYVGGIVVGAPIGLLFRAVTGRDAALTATMIATMVLILIGLRGVLVFQRSVRGQGAIAPLSGSRSAALRPPPSALNSRTRPLDTVAPLDAQQSWSESNDRSASSTSLKSRRPVMYG